MGITAAPAFVAGGRFVIIGVKPFEVLRPKVANRNSGTAED